MTDIIPSDEEEERSRELDIFEQFSMFASQGSRGFNMDSLSDGQRDKMMDILGDHENNAYNYHLKKLEYSDERHKRELKSSDDRSSSQRNMIIIAGVALLVVTGCFMIFRQEFITHWFAFLGGLGGGYGASKVNISISTQKPVKSSEE